MIELSTEQRENVEKWVKALRSGEYKQGQRQLRAKPNCFSPFRYCCLGVAADLYGVEWVGSSSSKFNWEYCPDGEYGGTLPLEISEAFGLTYEPDREWMSSELIRMNDEDGKSFEEIADYIEDRLLNGGNSTQCN